MAFKLIRCHIQPRFMRFNKRINYPAWSNPTKPHSQSSVKILPVTPAASAEIHSITGTKENNILKRIIELQPQLKIRRPSLSPYFILLIFSL